MKHYNEDDLREFMKIFIKQQQADGCTGCKYLHLEDWDMPCRECKRSHKDYYRYDKDSEKNG